MKSCPSEHIEQKNLVEWAEIMAKKNPELRTLYAVPNGGDRHPATAARLKAEGVKPGVPDLVLPVARGGFHALYIEMKRQHGGRLAWPQKWWHSILAEQGNKVEVCHGFDEARRAIEDYLKQPAKSEDKE